MQAEGDNSVVVACRSSSRVVYRNPVLPTHPGYGTNYFQMSKHYMLLESNASDGTKSVPNDTDGVPLNDQTNC